MNGLGESLAHASSSSSLRLGDSHLRFGSRRNNTLLLQELLSIALEIRAKTRAAGSLQPLSARAHGRSNDFDTSLFDNQKNKARRHAAPTQVSLLKLHNSGGKGRLPRPPPSIPQEFQSGLTTHKGWWLHPSVTSYLDLGSALDILSRKKEKGVRCR